MYNLNEILVDAEIETTKIFEGDKRGETTGDMEIKMKLNERSLKRKTEDDNTNVFMCGHSNLSVD